VTITRWHTGTGGETARLLPLAAAALEDHGVPTGQARKYMFYAKRNSLGTSAVTIACSAKQSFGERPHTRQARCRSRAGL